MPSSCNLYRELSILGGESNDDDGDEVLFSNDLTPTSDTDSDNDDNGVASEKPKLIG